MTMSRFSTSAHRRHFSTAGKPQLPHLFAKHLGDATSAAAWTALINDLARAGDSPDALRAFSSMRRLAVKPLVSSFPCSIKACAALAALLPGQQLHLQALALGFAADIFVSASLVDLYSKCGRLDAARRAFLDASSPNVFSWTALIAGYVKNAYPKEALLYFKDLLLHCVGADAVAAVAAASACAAAADIESTRGVQCWVVKSGLEADLAVQNVLIEAYAEAGEVELARKVFDGMRERDVVSWNSIFAVYARNGMSPMAIEAFCAMVRNGGGVHCNAVTLSTLLLACAHTGALQLAKCIHDQVIIRGLEQNLYVGTSLVDMYCKCGRVDTAKKAFDCLSDKNVKTWTAMIAGYGTQGCAKEALELFVEMQRSGVQPNYITLISVLAACSHEGLIEEGRHWFMVMREGFKIEPGVEHYACMVDLLGRAGFLHEAYSLIGSMRVTPDTVVWGALLAACRMHKNVQLGEVSARNLFELDPGNCGYYILLSNLYADAGRWDDVKRMRVAMKQKGLIKAPGFSLVEVKGRVHVFLVGDKEHPKHREVYQFLEILTARVQNLGYVPNIKAVLHDVDVEEKESNLRVHSEKFAIAFGILRTVPGTIINITKNLRVCGDCHAWIKLTAKSVGREIVVRDSYRFHHFNKEGQCSCGDFW